MVKYTSRINNPRTKIKLPLKDKTMPSKVAQAVKAVPKPIAENIPVVASSAKDSYPKLEGGKISADQAKKLKSVAKKVAPVIKKVVQKIKQVHVARAGIPMGGKFQDQADALDDATIDQLDPHVFTHMLNNMDMPTHNLLKGIAANYLGVEHPMRLITRSALGGDFKFPKHLSRIAMRDIVKANSPQQLASALHSEIMDMQSGKLSREEMGGGLFSSLKTLVKRGVKGARTALTALGKGAAGAVKAISKGAAGAQHIGKSVNNALMQGIAVANALSPIITEVFPASEGILKSGIGHAKAASELTKRGIDIAERVGQVADKPGEAFARALGELSAPIVAEPPAEVGGAIVPQGHGLDLSNVDTGDSDISGPKFVS